MQGASGWILGGVAGFIAFLGLLAASRASDEAFYVGGWVLAVAGIAYIFFMVKRHYDRREGHGAHTHDLDAAHRPHQH